MIELLHFRRRELTEKRSSQGRLDKSQGQGGKFFKEKSRMRKSAIARLKAGYRAGLFKVFKKQKMQQFNQLVHFFDNMKRA
jgi:hypothetical protein